jgi:citrate synthase
MVLSNFPFIVWSLILRSIGKKNMSSFDSLSAHSQSMKTRVGMCYPGSHANFRGYDLHRELKDMDWVELYVFGITGRRFSKAQIQLLHAIWVYTSYPDARLWNNRVAALATSARSSSNLGMAAAIALSEATVYGGRAGFRSMEFLMRALTAVEQGQALTEVVNEELKHRSIYGYGRPINSTDERIPWMLGLLERLGLGHGPHLHLAFEVEKILVLRLPKLRMNYAALHAALMADMGLTLREYQLLRVPTFVAGMAPCAVEASERPQGTLFPTACKDIAYEGVQQRSWVAS